MKNAGIDVGEEFKEDDFEAAIDARIRSIYMDTGYLYAEIIPELKPIGKDTLNVKIQIVLWMCAFLVAITWAVRHISVFEFARTLQDLPIIRWAAVFVCISSLSTLWFNSIF